eukprot:CAMPEP_0195522286 /NCGR_PEP_ID=MMETSP0794_2-20130614/20296_1 /TAXON_ID=515487 /ORGANISM="Stephanopyxis turris, Strain CCMP 815" /LENGTH=229 /DNA_ID=CAMNT_0040652005 /DNA_START=288 /DNA_END=977 /DNA_ORIENTATION=+
MEVAAVRRFTISYDKLCKSCPTRIQPRVDTLVEMILGLSNEDREELLVAVASRVEENDSECLKPVRSSKDVYNFQTQGTNDEEAESRTINGNTPKKVKIIKEPKTRNVESNEGKFTEKLEKAREKFARNQIELDRVDHLLNIATALLVQYTEEGKDQLLDEEIHALDTDPRGVHEIDELRLMGPDMLQLQRLKYMHKKAKCEGKMAKCRVKAFSTNLELAQLRVQQLKS